MTKQRKTVRHTTISIAQQPTKSFYILQTILKARLAKLCLLCYLHRSYSLTANTSIMPTTAQEKAKALRQTTSRKAHAIFKLSSKRPSVTRMITDSNYDRLPNLIPLRHFRMSASPFIFYRGTASIMARDLSILPNTGIHVQAVGDCHLMNFGGFATPERTLIFDVNDFDETHPAPWEWDVKRLATSFVLAARHISLGNADAKNTARALTESYRESMAEYAGMNMLDLWYMKFDLQSIRDNAKSEKGKKLIDAAIAKAQKNSHQQVFYKITKNVLGMFEIAEQHPLVYHPFDVKKGKEMIIKFLGQYSATLQNDRNLLFSRYRVVDIALKVVGVGSVGTRCYVVLMLNEKDEPLFMQVKEARQSVLEPYTSKSGYAHNGQRIISGQRLVQAASDIFLGWSTGPEGRHFYLRQLRDKKMSPNIDHFDKELLTAYAVLCGRMLARAHAKAGDAQLLSSYMGRSNALDEAMSNFAVAYADQTEKDYDNFIKAIKTGKLPSSEELSDQD